MFWLVSMILIRNTWSGAFFLAIIFYFLLGLSPQLHHGIALLAALNCPLAEWQCSKRPMPQQLNVDNSKQMMIGRATVDLVEADVPEPHRLPPPPELARHLDRFRLRAVPYQEHQPQTVSINNMNVFDTNFLVIFRQFLGLTGFPSKL
jgi:hypothetical protein